MVFFLGWGGWFRFREIRMPQTNEFKEVKTMMVGYKKMITCNQRTKFKNGVLNFPKEQRQNLMEQHSHLDE